MKEDVMGKCKKCKEAFELIETLIAGHKMIENVLDAMILGQKDLVEEAIEGTVSLKSFKHIQCSFAESATKDLEKLKGNK